VRFIGGVSIELGFRVKLSGKNAVIQEMPANGLYGELILAYGCPAVYF
jgi:hypothetical protein